MYYIHGLKIIPQHTESIPQQMDEHVTFYSREKKKEAVYKDSFPAISN